MTETKFTPGPWIVRTLENFGRNIVHHRNGDRHDILRVAKVAKETDAHLIAAAPDLLESLTNLVGLAKLGADRLDKYHAALSDAEAALAKARGEA